MGILECEKVDKDRVASEGKIVRFCQTPHPLKKHILFLKHYFYFVREIINNKMKQATPFPGEKLFSL